MSKRIGFPKRAEDIEKLMEEISEHEHEEHHHHHHHHEEGGELRMIVDSLGAKVSLLEERLSSQGLEVARLYRVIAHLVEALATESEEERKRALREAIKALE
ncbi:MAG: hypothetical protein N3F67_00040 [Acidilobaceae archaeon]|nr:hypothetical protein [Acidilobaceae archaeon]